MHENTPTSLKKDLQQFSKISVPFVSLERNFKSDITLKTISKAEEEEEEGEIEERCYIARMRYLSSFVPSGECRMPLSLLGERENEKVASAFLLLRH